MTPALDTLVSLGERVDLVPTARDAGRHAITGKTYRWSSSHPEVAAVSRSGEVTAVANGSSEITASIGGVSGTAVIVVQQMSSYLTFLSQPTATVVEIVIAPEVKVAVSDSGGSTVVDAEDAVTVAISAGSGSGTLTGTTTISATGGVASFTDLAIDQEGDGYRLVATAAGVDTATSDAFDVWSSLAHIDSVQLHSDTLAIDGFASGYAATVSSLSDAIMHAIVLQAYIDQGSATRAAGGTAVRCSDVSGDLPRGTCSFGFTVRASNAVGGSGTLVPGAASARFELKKGDDGTTLDTLTKPVTLIEFVEPPLPQARIDSIVLSSTTLTIGGASVPYTATVTNEESDTLPTVVLQAYIDQGSAKRAAGGTLVRCSDVGGDLPPGTCSFGFSVRASNAAGGSGTLVPGAASARFELFDMYGRVVDTINISVDLVN